MLSVTIGDWELARDISEWIEILAIATIVIGVIGAIVRSAAERLPRAEADGDVAGDPHDLFRQFFARWLLLGLDLLIAADVIRTVTLEPTLENVAALGLLVVVRTFLAWSLVLELEKRWPWQRAEADSPPG